MQIHESSEDYLESILMLKERKGFVRSIDIANELDYTKASVSVAMKKLRESGLIEMAPDGMITLLPEGMRIATAIYERHVLLSQYLIRLGVDPKVAAEDACRIEHVISEESFGKIKAHAEQYTSSEEDSDEK